MPDKRLHLTLRRRQWRSRFPGFPAFWDSAQSGIQESGTALRGILEDGMSRGQAKLRVNRPGDVHEYNSRR